MAAPTLAQSIDENNSSASDNVGDSIGEEAGDFIGEQGGDFIGEQGGGVFDEIFDNSGGIDEEFLEDQTGIIPDVASVLNTFFNINIEQGRFSLRNLGSILGSILPDEQCPTVIHIVPGVCPDGTEGLELPEAIAIEDDGEVRGSGELRRNSQPQQDALSSNRFVIERDLANLFDQESSRAFAFDYLGETGDQWLLSNTGENLALLEGSSLILEDLIQLATDAQELEVTQDVMKNMAGMNQLSSQIDINNGILLGRINTSLLNIQQQNASQMQLSSNISEALDEANRARRTQKDIASVESFRTGIFIPGLAENQ